jgi:arylsulfatase A
MRLPAHSIARRLGSSSRFYAALSILLAAAAPSFGTDESSPPGVVIFIADDLGYADIGVYGARGIRTPNLDRLAREGRRFTNFHVAQAVCSASRTALLTGCYPNRLGIHGALGPQSTHGIHEAETTLAELLRGRGYSTAAFGKWHLGHLPAFLPCRHGFDEYFGLPYSNDMWPHHPAAKPGTYPPLPLIDGDKVVDDEVTPEEQKELTARYTERAVRFLEQQKEKAPFFLYVAYAMPHVPLFASPGFEGKSERGLYGDVIEEIDASVGTVLAALERIGATDRTLVMFLSDNGPWLSYGEHAGSAGPFREGKGTVWEGGTRVPCILRWPGMVPAGTTSEARWMSIDVLPTIAKRVGAPPPALPIDGLDVWEWITGAPGAQNPHAAYFHYYAENELQAVSTGDGQWKLVLPHEYRTLGGKPGGTGGKPVAYEQRKVTAAELYELPRDPAEEHDVACEHPDVVRKLESLAEAEREVLGDALHECAGRGAREPGRVEIPRK